MKGFGQFVKDQLIESSLSRIQSKIDKHAVGAITAFRGEFTRKENLQRNRKLLSQLQREGFQVTTVKGSYIENYGTDDAREVGETSYFVVNPKEGDDKGELERVLVKLGKEYDQDSILTVPFGQNASLIGTSKRKNSYPPYNKKESVGKAKFGDGAQFFSRIRGRKFAFESITEEEFPGTINGIRGMIILSEKDWKEIDI